MAWTSSTLLGAITTLQHSLVAGFNNLETYEFVNGKDYPHIYIYIYNSGKIKFMFQTSNPSSILGLGNGCFPMLKPFLFDPTHQAAEFPTCRSCLGEATLGKSDQSGWNIYRKYRGGPLGKCRFKYV